MCALARIVTKRVAFGELKFVPRTSGTLGLTRIAERVLSRRFAFIALLSKGLRQSATLAGALDFEKEIRGSERNPRGCVRDPEKLASNSRALWLTRTGELTG